MQLSSRIFAALAVLILAVAVVSVRGGVETGVVDAATGTIDALNVGTCYTTNDEVFNVGDCDDGDDVEGYNVAERESITESTTLYATYAHDPKSAPDDPRGILENSDVIKISISDSGRDKRTPVLLPVGNAAITLIDAHETAIGKDFDIADLDLDKNLDNGVQTATNSYWALRETTRYSSFENRTTDLTFDASGLFDGLHVLIDDGANSTAKYKPMDVADGAVIKFYGTVGGGTFGEIPALNLTLDEDVGSGRAEGEVEGLGAIAPWLSVRVGAKTDLVVDLDYIVYHTSEVETLIGDATSATYAPGSDSNPPNFVDDKEQLTVMARSDGRDAESQLRLKETGRFTGRYEGYLLLTDENGDDGSTTGGTRTPGNWGLEVKDASDADRMGAAVLGVESGPVTIRYVDTDKATRTLNISIDTVPPAVLIDSPAHRSEGQDTSPEFVGTFNDGESGLRDDSFRLYVHHAEDLDENGIQGTPVLSLPVNLATVPANANDYGNVAGPASGVVESADDYTGYTSDRRKFGVLPHADIFNLEADDGNDNEVESIEADRYSDGATDATFGDSVRISFSPDDYNDTIDFQALVADIAGNIGFSDSDDSGPNFINDLGEKSGEQEPGRYNVLGWYARHLLFLDEVDPAVFAEQSVTGFYDEDDDGKPIADRSGILVAFDRGVDPDSVDAGTFAVTLDDESAATIEDVVVDGRAVYLKLASELDSDATPLVDIAANRWVSDPAGNRVNRSSTGFEAFEVQDGIGPQIAVVLSGGSGSGTGDEGPDSLTNESITVHITSDEEINGTPSLAVVCSDIVYRTDTDDDDSLTDEEERGLSDFTSKRSGALENGSANFDEDNFQCGEIDDDGKFIQVQPVQAYSRPGLEWEYQWQNFSAPKALADGKLTVVAYGRDRNSFASLTPRKIDASPTTDNRYNWGAGTAEFRYDITPPSLTPTPDDGDTVTDARPFVLLNYSDKTTVTVDEFSIDGSVQEVQSLGDNRYLYWPDSLSVDDHSVVVNAVDAAGNEATNEYSFKVDERQSFDIKLIAGWNAISFPANPIEPGVENVFTNEAVDMIAAWDASDAQKPWSIATKVDGLWTTHGDYATLTRVSARFGYWVHAQGFATQSVDLVGRINREAADVVPPDLVEIPTHTGWNFVGVIDQDGDQTEDNFGEPLMNGDDAVDAGSYLGENARAYTWDAIRSEFELLSDDDEVEIGEGVWVYFADGFDIAP